MDYCLFSCFFTTENDIQLVLGKKRKQKTMIIHREMRNFNHPWDHPEGPWDLA